MTEHQRASWLVGGMQVGVRPTVRGVHFKHLRSASLARARRPGYRFALTVVLRVRTVACPLAAGVNTARIFTFSCFL